MSGARWKFGTIASTSLTIPRPPRHKIGDGDASNKSSVFRKAKRLEYAGHGGSASALLSSPLIVLREDACWCARTYRTPSTDREADTNEREIDQLSVYERAVPRAVHEAGPRLCSIRQREKTGAKATRLHRSQFDVAPSMPSALPNGSTQTIGACRRRQEQGRGSDPSAGGPSVSEAASLKRAVVMAWFHGAVAIGYHPLHPVARTHTCLGEGEQTDIAKQSKAQIGTSGGLGKMLGSGIQARDWISVVDLPRPQG
ncbi:hypothetical protein BJ546DRAFT_954172 [Cryomyces antarcticus]